MKSLWKALYRNCDSFDSFRNNDFKRNKHSFTSVCRRFQQTDEFPHDRKENRHQTIIFHFHYTYSFQKLRIRHRMKLTMNVWTSFDKIKQMNKYNWINVYVNDPFLLIIQISVVKKIMSRNARSIRPHNRKI